MKHALVAAAVITTVVLAAPPAGADVVGGCAGRATFETGTAARGPFTVDPEALGSSQVVEVPIADTVAWEGALTGLAPPGSPHAAASLAQLAVAPRPIAGEVVVDLPWPLGRMVVGDWNSEADGIANTGEERYDLPSLVPRGVVFKVSGEHRENGSVFCSARCWPRWRAARSTARCCPSASC